MDFQEVVKFHGHACPGLAFGYRAALTALKKLQVDRSADEELVAIVENNSCAVDAIQKVLGCTFGKGNLLFKDFGKQVYTILKRPSGDAVRLSVRWEGPSESQEEGDSWQRYAAGDRSPEVLRVVHARKSRKVKAILQAADEELFAIRRVKVALPEPAKIYASVRCEECGEKVMAPRIREKEGRQLCIPCAEAA